MIGIDTELTAAEAARLAAIPESQLVEWLDTGLIHDTQSDNLNGSMFLAILLIKLLRSQSIPTDTIRPLSRFLSQRTNEDIEEQVSCGLTTLLGVGNCVAFVSPESRVSNESSGSLLAISVDVAMLMRLARLLQMNWMVRN